MAAIDTNPTQAWLGNIPNDLGSSDVSNELHALGYAKPVDVKIITKAGHKCSFAIVSFASQFDADYVKLHGMSWSNGKYAVVRTIPLYMTMSPPIGFRENGRHVFRIDMVVHVFLHLFVLV